MGRTLSQLVDAEPAFNLAGMVDSKEHVGKLAGSPCPVGDSLAAVLPQAPGCCVQRPHEDFLRNRDGAGKTHVASRWINPAFGYVGNHGSHQGIA